MDILTLAMAKKYADSQRLAYIENVEVIAEGFTTIEEGTAFAYVQSLSGGLEAGIEYTVTINDEIFTTTLKTSPYNGNYLGNGNLIDGVEDTGEPYVVLVNDEEIAIICLYKAYVKVSYGGTIHPIDLKFLGGEVAKVSTATVGQTVVVKAVDENGKPTEWEAVDMAAGSGGGLPVVELSTMPTVEGAQCTAAEAEQLNNAAALGLPAVIKSSSPDGQIVHSVATYGIFNGIKAFVLAIINPDTESTQYLSTDGGNTWLAVLQ